jgi:predicted DNA-binding protein
MDKEIRMTSFRMTKETDRQLKCLSSLFGENKTQVIVRAIAFIYHLNFKGKEEPRQEPQT